MCPKGSNVQRLIHSNIVGTFGNKEAKCIIARDFQTTAPKKIALGWDAGSDESFAQDGGETAMQRFNRLANVKERSRYGIVRSMIVRA